MYGMIQLRYATGTFGCHDIGDIWIYATTPIFSSPEPKAPGELIVLAGSVVRRRPSTISNDFSSEINGPIVTKFHM